MENRLAGIATDDEEGGEEEQGPEGDEEVPEGDQELGGEDGAGRRRSHQVQRTGTLNCRLVHETTPPLLLYKSVYNLF